MVKVETAVGVVIIVPASHALYLQIFYARQRQIQIGPAFQPRPVKIKAGSLTPGSAEILGAARLMRREGQYYVPLSTFP